MVVFKCKMCGGDLNIEQGVTVCECDYCGTKQTLPSADNEKKLSLFARANRLRFNSEFDKAAGIYESIVADFPEEAEAYWGLVLCKYGIEYVDDPSTTKKIPTCHRSSFDSLMDDPNFELVMEYADPIARGIYREEAKQIEELRKSIIEISSKEEPYDIFICYKETAEDGNRTLDSVIAQDVYKELTNEGYRVFFSRITLEDKLGKEYEPYIFAALNSAKVMLAFGTSYDHYNAVWVRNEWSRFLQLIAKGEKKTLIPCYKGIDAYDMPKEFAKLQAQDMGKVGAIQDLLRGIEKIMDSKSISEPTVTKETSDLEAQFKEFLEEREAKRNKRNKIKSKIYIAIKRSSKVLVPILAVILAAVIVVVSIRTIKKNEEMRLYNEMIDSLKVAEVGDTVLFGTYEQNNNFDDGKEKIEWIVLSKKDNKILVLSKYALDCKKYNDIYAEVTWKTCSLRKWLNGEFIDSSFSDMEKDVISECSTSTDVEKTYYTSSDVTKDKVFLLSYDEANRYLKTDNLKQCLPTNYATANGAYVEKSSGLCYWFLRTSGKNGGSYVVEVDDNGDIFEVGVSVDIDDNTVRPAMWIKLE